MSNKETKENPNRVYDIHTDTFHEDLTIAYAFAVDAGYQGTRQDYEQWLLEESKRLDKIEEAPESWDIGQAKEYLEKEMASGRFSMRHFLGGAIKEVERLREERDMLKRCRLLELSEYKKLETDFELVINQEKEKDNGTI